MMLDITGRISKLPSRSHCFAVPVTNPHGICYTWLAWALAFLVRLVFKQVIKNLSYKSFSISPNTFEEFLCKEIYNSMTAVDTNKFFYNKLICNVCLKLVQGGFVNRMIRQEAQHRWCGLVTAIENIPIFVQANSLR